MVSDVHEVDLEANVVDLRNFVATIPTAMLEAELERRGRYMTQRGAQMQRWLYDVQNTRVF